jgi:hypothetical protein
MSGWVRWRRPAKTDPARKKRSEAAKKANETRKRNAAVKPVVNTPENVTPVETTPEAVTKSI